MRTNTGKKEEEKGRGSEVRGVLFQNHQGTVSSRKVAFDQKPEQSKTGDKHVEEN